MSDRFFLDTNIFVYSFDQSSAAKARKATDLIREALTTQKGVISYLSPVAQSLLNNKVGDEVEFELHGAKRRHRIERIEAFSAAATASNGMAAVVSTP